ncbi:uncharacterized protein Tco025E_08451 [Trypanosoma conorhini]|uniref:Uncharacterized protein n=1 Tax=Trypanosoma conorhini TaxID=83891 RepID=A0A3R7KV97_9TRYP|nr:uncharacterized protein Tco025E_08451 [Trypanosoma conorhini]RNF02062.1 hypothetical protein Tco025E_08451 [Trypanosoma conorhini]
METADLVKTLLKADEECRVLREKVTLLEKTHRLRERDARALTAPPSEAAGGTKKVQARTLALPIEAVGELNSRAGDVTLLLREEKRLLKELKQLQTILEGSAADTVEANTLNTHLKQRIGYTEGETLFHLRDTIEEAAHMNGLKYEILQELRAREAVQATLKRQTEHMREYVTKLVASKELDEQRERAAQQLNEKRAELEGIREEVQSMRRLLERKEKQLENEKPVDELQIAVRAENERRTMLHRLEKEEEGLRQNEISIRHRSMQIAKLERRIEMIGDALAREESTDERVDAEIVDQLRKEILVLGLRHQKREAQQELLDANIVDLDRRCVGLVRTTANMKKEMQRIERNHRKYINIQKKELETEQMAAEQEIGEIEREIEMLRRVNTRRRQKAQTA